MLDYKYLNYPFKTGGGPSWGCVSLFVLSDRGVWQAHFWEAADIRSDDGFQGTLDFIQNGGDGYSGLSAAPYFGPDPAEGPDKGKPPAFIKAWVFAPDGQFVRPRADGTPQIRPPLPAGWKRDSWSWSTYPSTSTALTSKCVNLFQRSESSIRTGTKSVPLAGILDQRQPSYLNQQGRPNARRRALSALPTSISCSVIKGLAVPQRIRRSSA